MLRAKTAHVGPRAIRGGRLGESYAAAAPVYALSRTTNTAKSPNLNAFAERWAQSVQVECLNHFVVLGEDHLRYIVGEYVAYFNAERPHQAMDNSPLTAPPEMAAPADGEILCWERLGGLLRHYHRAAA